MAYQLLPYEGLKKLVRDIFIAYGFSEVESQMIADHILTSDLFGIESHGVQRMIRYHDAMKTGMVDAHARPETVFETPVSAVIDAKDAMGQLVGYNAMQLAIEKAKKVGIGMVAVRSSNHYGIAGYYTKIAADEDLIGVCMTNSEPIMVPTHGKKGMLGTNPISVSMPADPTPFLFDASTTVVTRGKLEVYQKKGLTLPVGWALDENGVNCENCDDVLNNIIANLGGGILPLGGTSELTGGHKGFGFGMICELFTSIMAGGPTSNNSYIVPGKADTSQCFWAIDYGIFGNKEIIRKNFSEFLNEIRNTPKAEGEKRIYIHGEKELESCHEKKQNGIPVNEKTKDEIKMIAESVGCKYEDYIN